IHPIFAVALQCLHFEEFIKSADYTFVDEELRNLLKNLKPEDLANVTAVNIPIEIRDLVEKYEAFRHKTILGEINQNW
ncbi:Uncharacterized protein APZ42_030039, partial [Daphnia magna]